MRTIPLSEGCRFLSGGTPTKAVPAYWSGSIPWFSPKDIKHFELLNSVDHISEGAVASSATQMIHPGTILVVARSGVLAHTLPVGIVRTEAAFNQDIKAIIPDSRFDPDFVALYLKAQEHRVIQHGVKVGATVHSLKAGFIESLEIPLLTPGDQRHLAARLTSQLAAATEARKAAQGQIDEVTRFIHAVIRASVSHPDAEPASLGDVLDEVKQGIGAGWSKFPVLGATRDGLAPAKEPVGKRPERYKPVVPGTVFYNPMRIMIGSIAMTDDDDAPGITSPDYVVLHGRPGKVDARWFYHWLRAPEGEHCIASLARGAVRERMLFNRLTEGEIVLPPYAVQVQASKALAETRHMRAAMEAQLRDIEMMPARLLSQAFDEYDA